MPLTRWILDHVLMHTCYLQCDWIQLRPDSSRRPVLWASSLGMPRGILSYVLMHTCYLQFDWIQLRPDWSRRLSLWASSLGKPMCILSHVLVHTCYLQCDWIHLRPDSSRRPVLWASSLGMPMWILDHVLMHMHHLQFDWIQRCRTPGPMKGIEAACASLRRQQVVRLRREACLGLCLVSEGAAGVIWFELLASSSLYRSSCEA
eukprot:CAMPEP_0177190142 /NCGR_PEP_ID=MMETSP0367-20130122/20654_1 /TAXON_ID=447022 ORGANISM="Scrippsiella hangoei-like, Strain SHHI-4" /NCGR_SAMPLE_ID=MMETSP0367 /ASSEMBLY_ACC=CAM_ASM_000362 /LENGTH=203 /DNA_ID=CAMNT_0018637747 /DNA_START=89 /DNA_END=700 /DNA_ORIENTATION=+